MSGHPTGRSDAGETRASAAAARASVTGSVDELLDAARAAGLPPGLESAFLVWTAQEVWEGREVSSFPVLAARAPELVSIFRQSGEGR